MRDDAPTPPTRAQLSRNVTVVFCWCNRCGHNDVVPLPVIIARLGPGLPFPMAYGRLRCQACGEKDIHARPDWPKIGQVTRHTEWPSAARERALGEAGAEAT